MKRFLRRLAFFAVFAAPVAVAAQDFSIITNGIPGCDFQTGMLEARCIPLFIAHVISIIFALVGSIFIINVMYAGYQMATGAISGQKEDGKNRLRWSIIGFIATSCAYLILDIVLRILFGT